ncbi:MAG TPA: formate/nitrite transporter family protein [Gemmatirosa sp.]
MSPSPPPNARVAARDRHAPSGADDGRGAEHARHAERGDTPRQQRRQARSRRQISAEVVHEAIRFEGEQELDRSTGALFWSGLGAGLTMGLSLVGQGLLRAALPDTAWRSLLTSLGYTVGFVFVVAGRQQLFTENTLTPVLPVLRERSRFPDLARLWAVVLAANLLGALAFAWVAAVTPVFQADAKAAFVEIGREVLQPSAGTLFLRAVVAGWLIALMVWLMPAAEHARLAMIIVPTYVIALAHLAHSIAGSVDVLYLVCAGAASWGEYGRFVLLALLGNVIGGVVFVALLNHKQVVAGGDGDAAGSDDGA